ncbi:hypothetical protein JXA85_06805 [Candidatus Woesearchaeota archaeon]|nr:hypothetical protein [Candidatus Woesearchaeota archaeon]
MKEHSCTVIIAKYNAGKSSIATELLHQLFGEENTHYVTFIDQSKPHFSPRKSRLTFGEIVKNKVIIFDEISDDANRDVRGYLEKLIKINKVIILSNPYGASEYPEREIKLFRKTESLPEDVFFIFVKA